jgi:hypothetical protein
MKKSMLSGLVALTIAMGGVAQASPTAKPTLPVVAGAKALSQSEKANVNGGLLDVVIQVNAFNRSRVHVTINNVFQAIFVP